MTKNVLADKVRDVAEKIKQKARGKEFVVTPRIKLKSEELLSQIRSLK